MTQDLEKLKREIEGLEQQISSHPFEGLFDRKRMDQLQDRLKKKRKELARMATGDDLHESEPAPNSGIHEFAAGAETMPDMGPDFPLDVHLDEEPERPAAMLGKSITKSTGKAAMKLKPAAAKKPAKKAPAKAKPKSKLRAKPKTKPAKKSKR